MDQAKPVGRIDVISDAICPWCYIGKRHLESALDILAGQQLHFSVAWHPFQLNPDMPREGVDRAQYRIAKFGGPERARQIDERITETERDYILAVEFTGEFRDCHRRGRAELAKCVENKIYLWTGG